MKVRLKAIIGNSLFTDSDMIDLHSVSVTIKGTKATIIGYTTARKDNSLTKSYVSRKSYESSNSKSIGDYAREVLQDLNEPADTNELIKLMKMKGWVNTGKNEYVNVYSVLKRQARLDRGIKKIGSKWIKS